MYLYIVRHGRPDYDTDTLLEEGWEQARAVAGRLRQDGIDEIHSSPLGRAIQTAQPLAEMLGKDIIIEDWAYELDSESDTTWPDGIEKAISLLPNAELLAPEKRLLPEPSEVDVLGDIFPIRYKAISDGLDGMLARCGYVRTPDGLYDPVAPNEKHIALFCHAAMSRVLFSHLLNIPFQLLGASLYIDFTGISVVNFKNAPGQALGARISSIGDAGHLFTKGAPRKHYFFKEMY